LLQQQLVRLRGKARPGQWQKQTLWMQWQQ
jgi:hypothetical protein